MPLKGLTVVILEIRKLFEQVKLLAPMEFLPHATVKKH